MFEIAFSKASNKRIHVYKDPPSIEAIALVKDKSEIEQIADARNYDSSSRTRSPSINNIIVMQNKRLLRCNKNSCSTRRYKRRAK